MEIDVRRIAKLAMLKLDEENIAKTEKEMGAIIKMVEHLPPMDSLDTLLDVSNTMQLRDDIIVPSTPRDEILANVPRTVAGCIVVPKTVEE